jgi:hypothetical protein
MMVDAGAEVEVWDGRLSIARGMSVLAARCRAGVQPPSTDCWAEVAARPEDVGRLQNANASSTVVVTKAP